MRRLTSIAVSALLVILPLFAALPVTDAFTNANGTILSVHNTCWQTPGDDWNIQSNAAHPAGSSTSAYVYWKTSCDTFTANQSASGTITALAAGTYVGVMVRASAGDNYYLCYSDASDQLYLRKIVAGSLTTLGTAAPATTGQTITAEANGTSLACKINGVTVASATDTDLATGAPGLAGYNNGASSLDNFTADNLGAAPAARKKVVIIQ